MAARKKKTETAGTFVPAPRIPATPEAMLRNAIGELVEVAIDRASIVMAEPVRGPRSSFSGDQQGERNTISFSYEHPREIALHERATVDLRSLPKKVTEAYDYEGQEAAVEALFMRPDFPRLLTAMVREAASQVVAVGSSTRTDTTLPEETADEIYDIISAASRTNYLAYDRNGETQKWAEYPSVYVRWSLWIVRSAVRDVSVKGSALMVDLNSIWSVESKRWSFDPEDLWPRGRTVLVPRGAGRAAGAHMKGQTKAVRR